MRNRHYGVQPDIVIIAKGIASGLPWVDDRARRDIMDGRPGRTRTRLAEIQWCAPPR